MYLNASWCALREEDRAILALGKNRGLLWLHDGDTTIGMLCRRWFYLRDGDMSMLRLPFRWRAYRVGTDWAVKRVAA